MSYQKHTWVKNEIIRGKQLNHIEDGIYDEEQRATQAESELLSAISNEIIRADNAEDSLSNRITLNTQQLTKLDASASVEGSIKNQIQTATSEMEEYVDERIAMTYKASGNIYFADLPSLVESRLGNVYNVMDAFITTSDFTVGSGKSYPADTNVLIALIEGEFYDEITPIGTENPSEEGWYEYDSLNDEYVATQDITVDLGKTYYVLSLSKLMYDPMMGFANYVAKTDYATTQAAGIVKPDGTTITVQQDGTIAASGQTSGVVGVKGNAEVNYRDGQVNLTPDNIGAVATTASQGLTPTQQSNARDNIGAGTSSFDGQYSSLTGTPTIPGGVRVGTTTGSAVDTTLYFIRS